MVKEELKRLHEMLTNYQMWVARRYIPHNFECEEVDNATAVQEDIERLIKEVKI